MSLGQYSYHSLTLGYKRLRDLLPVLVDPDLGIISYVQELPRQSNSPDFFYYKAEIADTGIFGLQSNRPSSAGTALDRDRAIAKAVGEAIERYASAIYSYDTLLLARYRDLNVPAIHPDSFRTQIHNEGRNRILDSLEIDTLIRWAPAIDLHTRLEVLVPAAHVYCPYTPDAKASEANVAESISTGLSAHCSFEEATINGILEVVERDSFMMTWLCAESCPIIDPQSLTDLHHEMLDRCRMLGYHITLLYAAKDAGIPTCIAVMKGSYPGSVPFVVAAAAHLEPEAAVTKCIEELALMERFCKRVMLTLDDWVPGEKFEHVVKLVDHLKYWLNPAVIGQADFLTASQKTISLSEIENLSTGEPKKDLSRLVNTIHNTGYQVLVSDITSEDIDCLGLKVVRALIPGYIPLTIQYACRPEGSQRLLHHLDDLKVSAGKPKRINPLPHPFA